VRLGYFVSETVQNLRRNFLMTVAAISTVAISLLLLGGTQILGLIVNNVTLNWEAKVEISAYLHDNATQNEISALEEQISEMPEVQEVTYVSKDQAFDEFREMYETQPEFYENLPEDALPASLRVKLQDADDTETTRCCGRSRWLCHWS
jgi:cell division transport system permease protein